ncbi:hypothetical protein IWX90DRAFT_133774 [Phyllosticta citrichinensis]|uniref:Protein kinase domain-containing protein n=1 Tax=Phyllosticta citrichinensis TaxID=1130410 RepID=A0ABR1Y5F0_9PEZI
MTALRPCQLQVKWVQALRHSTSPFLTDQLCNPNRSPSKHSHSNTCRSHFSIAHPYSAVLLFQVSSTEIRIVMETVGSASQYTKPPEYLSVTGQPLDLHGVNTFRGNCAAISSYRHLSNLGKGAQGEVTLMIPHGSPGRASLSAVAVKRIGESHPVVSNGPGAPPDSGSPAGLHQSILREVSILRRLERHLNIIALEGVAVGDDGVAESQGNVVFMNLEACKVRADLT